MPHLRVVLVVVILLIGSMESVHSQSVFPTYSVDWSPDDQWVATTSGDNRIRIWNAATGLVERSVEIIPPSVSEGFPTGIMDVEWSPSGDRLAFIIRIDRDTTLIRIVDAATFKTLSEIPNDGSLMIDWVSSIEWSPDGNSLAGATSRGVGALDSFVRVWNAASGTLTYELKTNSDIHTLEWNPDSDRPLIAMSGGPLAQIWNINSGIVHTLEGHEGALNSVSWHRDGTQLATKDDITIQIWDATTGQNLNQIYLGTAISSARITWSRYNDDFIVQDVYELYVLNPTGTRIYPESVPLPNRYFDLNTAGDKVVISPDSQSIAIYNLNGHVIPFPNTTFIPNTTAKPTLTPTLTLTPAITPSHTPARIFTP